MCEWGHMGTEWSHHNSVWASSATVRQTLTTMRGRWRRPLQSHGISSAVRWCGVHGTNDLRGDGKNPGQVYPPVLPTVANTPPAVITLTTIKTQTKRRVSSGTWRWQKSLMWTSWSRRTAPARRRRPCLGARWTRRPWRTPLVPRPWGSSTSSRWCLCTWCRL